MADETATERGNRIRQEKRRRPGETDAQYNARQAALRSTLEAEQAAIRDANDEAQDRRAQEAEFRRRQMALNGKEQQGFGSGYGTGFSPLDKLSGAEAASEEEYQNFLRQQKELAIDRFAFENDNSAEDLTAQYNEGDVEAYQIDPDGSRAAKATADPSSIRNQYDALDAMQDVYNQRGLTDADRQGIRAGQAQNAQAMRGQSEAMMNNAEERGVGGSGLGFMAQLAGQQQLANANAATMAGINMNAQERALTAMQGAGNLSSNMRNSSFTENFNTAGAADNWAATAMQDRRRAYDQNIKIQNDQADENVRGKTRRFDQQQTITGMKTGLMDQNRAESEENEAEADAFQNQGINTVIDVVSGAPGTGEALNPTEDEETGRISA